MNRPVLMCTLQNVELSRFRSVSLNGAKRTAQKNVIIGSPAAGN